MADKPDRIDAATLKASLELLGWSQSEAARQLGVASGGRLGEWLNGKRPVPHYVSSHLARIVDAELKKRGL